MGESTASVSNDLKEYRAVYPVCCQIMFFTYLGPEKKCSNNYYYYVGVTVVKQRPDVRHKSRVLRAGL